MRQADAAIEAARQAAVQATQGHLPGEFQAYTTEIEGLRQRLTAIDLALKNPQAHDTLTSLKEQIRQLGEDNTLTQLRDHFQEKARATIPALVEQAQYFVDIGDTDRGVALLRHANELGANETDLLKQWTEDEALRNELDGLDYNYNDLKNRGSLATARDNRTRAITQLRTRGRLDSEMIQLLDALLRLNLGKDEGFNQANDYLMKLGKFGAAGGWAAGRAFKSAEDWAEVSRPVDLDNIGYSALSLHRYIEAYQAFFNRGLVTKSEEEKEKNDANVKDASEKMMAAMRSSAQSRLDRAKDLLEKENYDLARDELDEMEQFHNEVRIPYPEFVEGDEIAQEQIATAQEYRLKADLLQEHYDRVKPLLEDAQRSLIVGQHDDAARKLNEAGNLKKDAPKLAERIESLQSQIQTARVDNAGNRLKDEITRATTAITLASSLEEFDTAIAALKRIDPETLSIVREEDRIQYLEALRTAGEAREIMAEGQKLAEQATRAFEKEDYANAEAYYKRAIEIERSGSVRAALTQQLDKVRQQRNWQIQGRAALERAERALDEGLASDDDRLSDGKAKFFEARRALGEAKEFGLEKDDLLILVRVGLLWITARQEMINQDYVVAENGFNSARDALKTHPDQNDTRVHEFGQQIANWQEKRKTAAELETDLRAAENSLSVTRLDEAEQSANKVLAKSPQNKRAKEILAISATYRAAKETLETVDGWKNDPGKYKEAVDRLNATLEGLPKKLPGYGEVESRPPVYVEVESRKKEFERLVEFDRLKGIIEGDIRKGDYDQALASLEKMGAEGDEARKLRKQIDDTMERQETQVIQPIRQKLNQDKFTEALDLSRSALDEVRAPSIKQKIEALTITIVNRWARQTRDEVDSKLRDRQSHTREMLEGLIAELQQRLDQKPSPSDETRREVEQVQRAVKIRLLELRLVQIDSVGKEEPFDGAALLNDLKELNTDIENIKTLSESANDNEQVRRLLSIRNRTFTLQTSISDKIEEMEEARDAEERGRLMTAARQKFKDAVRKDDLLQAKALASRVLVISRYQNDLEAGGLRDQVDIDLSELETTEDTLRRSSAQLHAKAYGQALSTLRVLHPISRLRKKQVEDRLELLELLLRAQNQQDEARWEEALAAYESAGEKAPDLQKIWSDDLTVSREKSLDKFERLIDSDLHREPPDVDTARKRLESAVMVKLATVPEFNQSFESVKNRIQSHEHLVEAIGLLDEDGDGNAQRAADMLGKARSAVHDERLLDSNLASWEALAQALIAWEGSDRKGAEAAINMVQYPVSDTRRARELNDKIRKHKEKLTDVAKYLKAARENLEAVPPDRAAVIEPLRHVLELDPGNEAALTMANQLTGQLRREIEQDRTSAKYADALTQVKLLRDLHPDDGELRDLETTLTNERQIRLAEAYEAADKARRAYRLNDLVVTLALIETILHPETADRLTQLQEQRATLSEQLKRVDAELIRSRQHLDNQKWDEAKTSVEIARQDAPGYQAVADVVAQIQATIIEQSSQLLAGNTLKKAYELADLALALDPNPHEGLLAVQRDVRQRSGEVFREKQAAISRALGLWQLEEAGAWLAEDWYLLDQFDETKTRKALLAEMRRAYEVQISKTPAMLEKMKAGWQMLRDQQFEQAVYHFQQAAYVADKPFPEANEWVGYAQSLQKALTAVVRDSLDEATDAVAAGKGYMTAKSERLLASCLDGKPHLAAQRRQAAWNIARLDTQLQQMVANKDQVKDLTSYGQVTNDEVALDKAAELLMENIALRDSFPLILSNPTPPPDAFDGSPSAAGPPAGAAGEAWPPTEAKEEWRPAESWDKEATGPAAVAPAAEPPSTQPSEPQPPAPTADEPFPSFKEGNYAMPDANGEPQDALEPTDDESVYQMDGIDDPLPDTDGGSPGGGSGVNEPYDTPNPADDWQIQSDGDGYEPDEAEEESPSDDEQPVGDDDATEAGDAAKPFLDYEAIMGGFKPSPTDDYED